MEFPRIEGLKVKRLVGAGGCGSVYLAEDGEGGEVAVKVFEGMAIQRPLLARMTARLGEGGWPAGVDPVVEADFESRPCHRVTAWHGDAEGAPASLQHRLEEYPGEGSWPLVRGLADALAGMHAKQVAHGNLKPGNVFFDEGGGVLLSDWTLGNMPGVGHFEFTDAILYQPPEQLREAKGYEEGAGCRWDVFSFGVLAFRVLTGRFPRCDETFRLVAPEPGEIQREGIQADFSKIARNLENREEVVWPDAPQNALEQGYREWIDRCLELDPARRPGSMLEVRAGLEAVEARVAAEVEREHLMDQRRRADHRAWRACFAAGVAGALALVMGALWQLSSSRLGKEKMERGKELAELKEEAGAAFELRNRAEKEAEEARRALDYERNVAVARLEASRLIGDRLFAWAMEKGHRRLPPIDGRELRLKRLERYFEDFLKRTAEVEELDEERARARLQLAEISLAAGNADAAVRRLEEALDAREPLPEDPEWRLRMATNRLLLALLLQSANDPRLEDAFAAARTALEAVPAAHVDAERVSQLLAILDFHEAHSLMAKGENARALEQLMRATRSLNRLADERPDSVVLRSELAACYLSSATILEGMGNLGDAREVRRLAAGVIGGLLEENPDDPVLRFDLAGCYGAMAEASLLSGDVVAADSQSKEAIRLLEGLVAEQPDHLEAVSRLGAQIGLGAGLMADRGETEEALDSFEAAIRLLERVRVSEPGNATAAYRLALLWWQKGRMLGMGGRKGEEVALLRRAGNVLAKLEGERHPEGPSIDRIQGSSAYLLGDLGHALQLQGKMKEAKEVFVQSAELWDSLLASHPQSEEYQEGASWCRQRIRELEVIGDQ